MASILDKARTLISANMHEMLDKALEDIENLKDANREMKYTNGTH